MKQVTTVVLLIFLAISLGGCASNTGRGTAIGAGIGALAGQAIGGNTASTVIGAGVGALLGGLVGNYIDKQNKTRQEAARDLRYRPAQGRVVRIDDTGAVPVTVKPGDTVGLKASYYVVDPNPNARVRIKETRVVKYNGRPVMDPIARVVDKRQGMATSTAKFPVPDDAQGGEYEVLTVIEDGTRRDTKISKFYVQSI